MLAQDMGIRKMAYAMGKGKKKTDLGNYVLMNFECKPSDKLKMAKLCENLQKESKLLRFLFQRLQVRLSLFWGAIHSLAASFRFIMHVFHDAVAFHVRMGMPLAGHSHGAFGGGLRGVPHTDDVQPRADDIPQRTRFNSSLCSNH